MKPFNLIEALSGAPVVTRIGLEVTQLHLFEASAENQPLYGVLETEIEYWNKSGKYSTYESDNHTKDLFMAEEEKVQWINIWENYLGVVFCTSWSREDKADLEIENELNFKHLKKIKITL